MNRGSITITIPEAVAHTEPVALALRQATTTAGGVTITRCSGVWYDEQGNEHSEDSLRCMFLLDATTYSPTAAAVEEIAREMRLAGEKTVLIETTHPNCHHWRIE